MALFYDWDDDGYSSKGDSYYYDVNAINGKSPPTAHFGQPIGFTGFVPPAYLFFVWIQSDKPVLDSSRMDVFKERLPTWMKGVRKRFKDQRASRGRRIFMDIIINFLALASFSVFNWAFTCFACFWTHFAATTAFFGLYGLMKLVDAFRFRRGRRKWSFYIAVVLMSSLLWW